MLLEWARGMAASAAGKAAQIGIPDYAAVLQSFKEVVNPSKILPPVTHKVIHHIVTSGRPVAAKYRRLDPVCLKAAKEAFLEKQGIVRRSDSQWASPLHLVKKSDGTWRPCGNFRRLNLITTPDHYTCPNIGDLTARLAGCKVFTKLDLRKGYLQVPVREEDICKTAIITPFGTFEFLRMPFGLRNAGQTFQRMMDSVMAGLDFCFIYLDDVLVASQSHEEHLNQLKKVLTRLKQQGLVLNEEKCVLGASQVEYLGHLITPTGVSPLPDRVKAITGYPLPATVRGLQTFLGMANFYRRFLKDAALLLRPLTDALKGGAAGKLLWTPEMKAAFESGKRAVLNAAELAHPEPDAEISLAVDASGTHAGAVLQQRRPGGLVRPLAFFSVKLNSAQQNYSAFDRELLAAYLAVKHFSWFLEGRKFFILSDRWCLRCTNRQRGGQPAS